MSSIRTFDGRSVPASDKGAENDAYFDSLWSDDMYRQAIEQYRNESWYDRLMDNPYLRSKQARFETDPITGLFNYQAAAAKYYGGMRTDAMNWLSKKVDEMRQQDYDSASAQAERERSAGLNPDLLQNVTPGAAAENDNLLSPSFQNGTSESGMQIAKAGIDFISNVISFGTQLQQLNIGAASLISQDLANNSSAFDFGVNTIAGLSDIREMVVDNSDLLDSPSFVEVLRESVKKGNHRFSSGFNPRTRKLLDAWFERLGKGDPLAVQAVRSKLRKDVLSNNQTSAEIMSNPWYSDDFNEWIGNIGEHFSKFVAITNEYQARASAAYSQTEGEFAETPAVQAQYKRILGTELDVREKTADASKLYQDYQSKMNDTWDDLMSSCFPAGEKRKWYHTIGSILIMALRTQFSQPLHFGFSRSSSDSFGRNGSSHSVGSSWHF